VRWNEEKGSKTGKRKRIWGRGTGKTRMMVRENRMK
jgi:hypothetical protein